MGVDPITIGLGASVIGAGLQYGETRAARRRAQQMQDRAIGLTSGGNYADIEQLLRGQINSGQDSFLQMLRANPNMLKPFQFDASSAFKQLQAQDLQTTADQVAGLRSSVGSLGERFGTGFASREAILRSRLGSDIAARNAGIAQSSFQNALQAGLTDFQAGRQNTAQLLGLLLNTRQTGISQQLQALGLGSQIPIPGFGAQVGQTGADIASLMLLGRYLNGSNRSTGGYTGNVNGVGNFLPTGAAGFGIYGGYGS